MLQEASPPRWNSSEQRMAGHGVIMMSHIGVGVQRVGGECLGPMQQGETSLHCSIHLSYAL